MRLPDPLDRTEIGITHCPPSRGSGRVVLRPMPQAIKVPVEWGEGPGAEWYVVAIEPAKEYRVRDRLSLEGWAVWLPECVVERQHKRFAALVSRLKGPLFPGYLFIRIDMLVGRWRILEDDYHRESGVARVLRIGDHPRPVPGTDMERLRLLVDADGGAIIIRGRQRRQFVDGEGLRVIDGPFTGFDALYLGVKAKDRINILLDILGRNTVVEATEAQVEPV